MEKMYRSPYEAYPYLSSKPEDLRCDFELMTDELASMTGLLRGYEIGRASCRERV